MIVKNITTLLSIALLLLFSCKTDSKKEIAKEKTTEAHAGFADNLVENKAETKSGKAPKGMVHIPGGIFTMGSQDPNASQTEGPAYSVQLSSFYIDATEVTNAQYEK